MSEADNAAQPATGLGERLARARERRGLTLLQAAEKLHLEPRVVEALEAEEFDTLGAAVYVRGHLQRYAELVGENAAELLALYAARPHAHVTPDLTRVITERSRGAARRRRFGVWQGALLTLGLVVAALVWWAIRSGPAGTESMVVPPRAVGGDAAHPAAAPQAPPPAPPVASARASRPAPVVTTAPPAERPSPASPAAPTRAGEPPAVVQPAPAAAAPRAGAAPTAAAPAAATPAGDAATLVLRFREDSWAEVYDASGTPLYRDIATAGAVQTLRGAPPLRLVLGNAAGVGISLDGRDVTLGATLQSTPNAHFRLDRGGRVTETP
jgi:cytoskeleton protein RodZ